MWTIYAAVNTTNDKVYIGQTQQTVQERWKQHCAGAGGAPSLWAALEKHGPDMFHVGPLATFDTQELADTREQEWIASLNTRNPDKGYNITHGGGTAGSTLEERMRRKKEARFLRIWLSAFVKILYDDKGTPEPVKQKMAEWWSESAPGKTNEENRPHIDAARARITIEGDLWA